MSNKRPAPQLLQTTRFPMPPRAVGSEDLRTVESMVARVAPAWTVELHGLCAQDTSLVVLPEDGDDAMGPSFSISRDAGGFRLDRVHWDDVTEVGVFPSLPDVMDAMCASLGTWTEFARSGNVTVH
jgi:hypothetical protein